MSNSKDMNCSSIRALLSSYIDNELTDAENFAVTEHISGCESCKKLLSDMYKVQDMVKSVYAPKGDVDFSSKIMANIKHRKPYGAVSADDKVLEPNFAAAPNSMKVNVSEKGNGVALINKGYWGLALQKDATYRLRMFMRSSSDAKEMTVRLLGPADKELGKAVLTLKNDNKWQEYKAEIQAMDTTTAGRLAIELPENGVYYFDYVSLFPKDTYKGRENGMRKDVAEVIL